MPSTSSLVLSDQATINANRYGQLTPWQRQQLKPPSLLGPLTVLGLVGSFLVGMSVLFFAPFAAALLSGEAPPWLPLIVLGVVGFFVLALLPLLLVQGNSLAGRLRLRRDLLDGSIAQDDGQVTFKSSVGYVARVQGRPLSSMDGDQAVDLAPGSYRFYYLPRTGRILSAERQPLFEPGGPQAGLLAALAEAHGFSLEELDLNRQGWVSGKQRAWLIFKVLVLAVIIAGGVAWATWQFALVLQYSPWSFLGGGLALFLLLMLLVQRWRDLQDGRVQMLEGFVRSEEHSSSDDGSTYYYVLGNESFSVSGAAHRALVKGQRYRLYYLPRSKKLVSIEPLP